MTAYELVVQVSNLTHWESLLKEYVFIIADFSASWCGPCSAIAPLFEDLAQIYRNEILFVKVDVDKCSEVAEAYNVSSMPTFLSLISGQVVSTCVGANSAKLQELCEALYSSVRSA